MMVELRITCDCGTDIDVGNEQRISGRIATCITCGRSYVLNVEIVEVVLVPDQVVRSLS